MIKLNHYYHPKVNQIVIGVIVKKSTFWLVDIGTSHYAFLPTESFDEATKRSAPSFSSGEVILAKIEDVNANGPIILTCINSDRQKDLGKLQGGIILRLRSDDYKIFDDIAFNNILKQKFNNFKFKIAMNNKVWFDTTDPIKNVLIYNAFYSCLSGEDPKKHFSELISKL